MGEDREEEKPEGEVVAGPSGEGVVHSSGNAPLFFLLENYFINLYYIIFLCYWVYSHLELCSFLILLAHESDEEGGVMTETKEEQELGVMWSWIEVRGFPTLDEGEVQKLSQEVYPLS